MTKKLTTPEFIAQAVCIHGNKYDYSKAVYVADVVSVIITCPIHGDFSQRPSNHKQGAGCPNCWAERKGKSRRVGVDAFARRAIKIHGDKYDYSKVCYLNQHSNVTIICKIHGDFEQTPNSHLAGRGCQLCGGSQRLTKLDFVQKAMVIHGDKYSYTMVEYVNVDTPVKILCDIHGCYEQTPYKHMQGHGCRKCSRESMAKALSRSTADFITEAQKAHGDTYDYSQVNYVNAHTPVMIICKDHGSFWQSPNAHIRSSGCPTCSNPLRGEQMIADVLDNYNISYYRQVSFNGCKDERPLWFDFYLPDRKILIEFDGKQHFQPVRWFGGVDSFKSTKRRDEIKTMFAEQSGLSLIRLNYKDLESRRLVPMLESALCNVGMEIIRAG